MRSVLAFFIAFCMHAHAKAACVLPLESAGKIIGEIQVEVASDAITRSEGLMYRQELPEGHGMLLIYPFEGQAAVWMRNTYIPLDIIFMDKTGTISRVVSHAVPGSEYIHRGEGQDMAVLEINAGEASAMGLAASDRARLDVLVSACNLPS